MLAWTPDRAGRFGIPFAKKNIGRPDLGKHNVASADQDAVVGTFNR